ncbi:hypothetical protein D3C81_1813560 [compost metagenome]
MLIDICIKWLAALMLYYIGCQGRTVIGISHYPTRFIDLPGFIDTQCLRQTRNIFFLQII